MILAILGTGNMAEALIAGLVKNKVLKPSQIVGFDVNGTKLSQLRKKYGIRTATDAASACRIADTVLLSVKPQQLAELLATVQDTITKKHLIFSIAAGIDTKFLSTHLNGHRRLVRLMPNTPALLGLGATGYYIHPSCSAGDRKNTCKIFEAVGHVVEVKKEDLLDSITGLSGSGPAYVYTFLSGLIEGGKKAGLSEDLARSLAFQTVRGAVALAESANEPLESLIAKVASKGGTTEAGLKVLKGKKFTSIIEACVGAATKRAKQLRRG